MDDLIEKILAELPHQASEDQQFTDLNDQVPLSVRLPADQWDEILDDPKDKFEVDGASAVFSTWRVEREDPLDIADIEIADGIHARSGDARATQLLAALLEGNFILRLKFLREDKFDPVRTERKKGQGVIEISRDTKPGVLTGIDSVFYQNA